ncbi:transcriptional regulator [uncultured Brevibacillus sp.]|uniref:transcriptional regulator n=1 Tax=uncultured Brevibacillus sp. TaxID=169970 RepID=UPI0025917EC1|nr:transcriptional regulator [uncultured Brevibacillus sp.]
MIRIAVISSKYFIDRVTKYNNVIPNIEITPYIYDHPDESAELVERIDNCDVMLFAGPLPYNLAKEKIEEKKLPAVYVPTDEYTLTRTLFHKMLYHSESLGSVSIDFPEISYIQRVSEELGLKTADWFIYTHKIDNISQFPADEIINFHKKNYEKNNCQWALTCVEIVYRQLQKFGIPCSLMIDPEKNIHDTIQKAIMLGQIAIKKKSQITVGLISFNQQVDFAFDSGHLKKDATIVLQQVLLELVKETETSIQQVELDQLILYGTRGSIEQLIDPITLDPFLQKINQFPGLSVSIGFGFGLSAKEAEANAKIALYHAQKNTEVNSVFLVTDEKKVIGPLNANSKILSLKNESKKVLEIADRTGISGVLLTKLQRFLKLRRENTVTVNELAEYLEISRCGAERLLKKLLGQNYAEKVGEEQPYQRGRPRAVYRLSLE